MRDRPGLGNRLVALITRMDQPLGRAVGNAVEVAECLECLRGGGPADLVNLSLELAAEMVVLAGSVRLTRRKLRAMCEQTIDDGSALERFRRTWCSARGEIHEPIDDPELLPPARRKIELKSLRAASSIGSGGRPVRARHDAARRGPCPDGQPDRPVRSE